MSRVLKRGLGTANKDDNLMLEKIKKKVTTKLFSKYLK